MIGYIGNYLGALGHTTQICEILSKGFEAEGMYVNKASHYRHPLIKILHIFLQFLKKRKHVRLYIVDTFSGKAFFWAYFTALLCKINKTPYIAYLHGGNLPTFSQKWPRIVNHYLQGAQIINSPSDYLCHWTKGLGYSSETIPNPIQQEFFNTTLNWSPQQKIILWVRRFHHLYHPQLALHTLHQLQQWDPEFELYMIGPDGGELKKCQDLSLSLALQNRVTFFSLQPPREIIALAKSCGCFLNTSRVDNTPSSLLEMSTLGLPIVTTSVGGIPYIYQHEINALLHEESAFSLAEGIQRIYTDHHLTKSLILEGKKLTQHRRLESILPQWQKLFNTILT